MSSIRSTLPIAHAPLLGDFFDQEEVHETRATCANCAMCHNEATSDAPTSGAFFKPDLKCCTYFPTLPNFLVGAILSDSAPEMEDGKSRIRARIATRFGITPMWLGPPRKYRVMLEAARLSSFGRSKVLLCPYFQNEGGGRCSIWKHREGICSTFFCKHDLGALGQSFWNALKLYLTHVERTLAEWARTEIAPDACEPTIPRHRMTIDDLEDRPPSDDEYFAIWGDWAGREEELYRATYERVRSLKRGDFVRLVDDTEDGRKLLATLAERYAALRDPKIKERLMLNKEIRTTRLPQGMGVSTYSIYDTFCLNDQLWDVLQKFDGNDTVATTLERLQKEQGIEVPEDLLLQLQNHDLLVPPDGAK